MKKSISERMAADFFIIYWISTNILVPFMDVSSLRKMIFEVLPLFHYQRVQQFFVFKGRMKAMSHPSDSSKRAPHIFLEI
jgi:hypothetical protein